MDPLTGKRLNVVAARAHRLVRGDLTYHDRGQATHLAWPGPPDRAEEAWLTLVTFSTSIYYPRIDHPERVETRVIELISQRGLASGGMSRRARTMRIRWVLRRDRPAPIVELAAPLG